MNKKPSPSLPDGMVDLIGMGYLANRPSFAKVDARLKAKGWTAEFTRDHYRLLMLDVKDLETLLKLTKVDRDKFTVKAFTVNRWGQDSWQVKAHLLPKVAPGDLPVQPAAPRFFRVEGAQSVRQSRVNKLGIPDIHFGYYLSPTGECIPTHDEKAVSLYLAVAYEYQPKTITIVGDLIDLAAISKFVGDPSFNQLIQYALNAAHAFLAALRAACPNARIIYIEGNHEARLRNYMRRLAPELANVTRTGEEHPAISIQSLLRLSDLGVEYIGEYGEHIWFDGVRALHGEVVGGGGGLTVNKMIAKYPGENTLQGHTHRLELAWDVLWVGGVRKSYWYASIGTGARVDGVVPGSRYTNWQQGLFLEWASGRPSVHEIIDGTVDIAGCVFTASSTD